MGTWRGKRLLAVSWFRQDLSGTHLASRVTLIDLKRSRSLDILLAELGDDGQLHPARIHAGGIAWFGDRLFAAATKRGIWEFNLTDLHSIRGAESRRLAGGRGGGARRTALVAVRTNMHQVDLRCSFIGRAFDEAGTPLPRVLIGEYQTDEQGQIREFHVPEDDGGFVELDRFVPRIARMQGAVRLGREHFVSQSDGVKPGTLWSGSRDSLQRAAAPLPVGCEDLALDLDERQLWSVGEHPWRRIVRGIPLSRVGIRG